MADKLRQLGFDRQVDEFVASLNHAAEKAAAKSKTHIRGCHQGDDHSGCLGNIAGTGTTQLPII